MSRRYYFAVIMFAIVILLSACGSDLTAEPSSISPTNTPVTPTSTPLPVMSTAPAQAVPMPTQSIYPPQQKVLEDSLAYIKQKYGPDMTLTEVGYAPVAGQEYVTLMVKVKCMSGNCNSGTLYQWVVASIAPFEKVPENLALFHIEVHGQQDELLEDVQGRWVDLVDMHNNKINMNELLRRLVFIR